MAINTLLFRLVAAVMLFTLVGCSSTQVQDGPPADSVDVSTIPDAIPSPIQVPLKNTPYTLGGIHYQPMASANGYAENGQASWYGTKFHGKQTANGEIYDMFKMTAAHKTLPLPSYVKVTNLENGQSVVVRVNDRGPFHGDRLIDLSYVAAKKLGFADSGLANVAIEGIDPETFARSPAHQRDGDLLYLQLAAFKNYHNAQLLRRDIFSRVGAQAKVVKGEAPESLYRVRIGPVESPDHLEELLEGLSSAEFASPFLVYEKPVYEKPVHEKPGNEKSFGEGGSSEKAVTEVEAEQPEQLVGAP
ncbi:septal ring lytic transglycosylase RlpA family protein [Endozoicomonas sp. SCSIO W0465]|uniref:septal ring lytic transglycosylase RlpA family protein n=1 Tax=Endozoicomonas sp. SCSIO W0465 TaxID=2918516 RepID=UPI00273A69AB|nr:septal ring lytic transglycosylase RlpA family protein [Endozoicomonas sp. SCSIO W0465]